MKWNLNFLKNEKILLVIVTEQFSIEEQKQMFEEIASFKGWSAEIPILFNNRALLMKNIDGSIIRQSVIVVRDFFSKFPGSKIAGLVNNDVNFGLGRQFEIYSDIEGEIPFRLFKDESLAIEWLLKADVDRQ